MSGKLRSQIAAKLWCLRNPILLSVAPVQTGDSAPF
jgi:hypothetical protein